jgi:TRAP-type C4-dicarboxylate transport system permease small subunit
VKFFDNLAKITDFIIKQIALILVIIMILNVWAAVLFRYVLHSSLFWSEELGRYLMIWFGYLGCAMALKENSHVNLNIFTNLFPLKIQKGFALFANLVISVFVIIVFLKSIAYFSNLSGQNSSSLQIPMVIPYSSITIGMVLMLIMNISNMVKLMYDISGAPLSKSTEEEK